MKILFVVRAVEHYSYLKSIVEALASRNHKVLVLFDRTRSRESLGYLKSQRRRGVTFDWAVNYQIGLRKIVFWIRDLASYIRYLNVLGQGSFYKERWRKMLFSPLRWFLKISYVELLFKAKISLRMFMILEKFTPPVLAIVDHIKQVAPDVVVASPVNMPYSSSDLEYLKAAKSLSIPTALPVFSWDNLTTKGLFHIVPDVLLVWNQKQVREAFVHHKISRKTTKVCGAFLFDFWFENLGPSQTKESFCKKWGLDVNRPIICYLETSESLTGDERWLVKQLSSNLQMQIIVRPHPFKSYFGNFNMPDVVVVPKKGTWPKDERTQMLYYDTLYFSQAVLGINTSGFIDAVCVDKAIVALDIEKYRKIQTETEHFRQLVESDVVDIIKTNDLGKFLVRLIAGGDKRGQKRRDFVKKFIRPRGFDQTAGEIAAEEIEKLGM